MGKYSGMTNEIVFEDEDQLLRWSDEEQTLSYQQIHQWEPNDWTVVGDESYDYMRQWGPDDWTLVRDESWHDLLPIRTYIQSCPLLWLPKFQIDAKWLSYEFPKGKLG